MFVPWEAFLSKASDDINIIWERQKRVLPPRVSFLVDNIQLLRGSAEDVKRDARQWAAMSGEADLDMDTMESGAGDDQGQGEIYRPDDIGKAVRLIDVLRSAMGTNQITAGSKEVAAIVQDLYGFEQVALRSTDDLRSVVVHEGGPRRVSIPGGIGADAEIPEQELVRSIKSQQRSLSREKESRIQGMQEQLHSDVNGHAAAVHRVFSGFGEDDVDLMQAGTENQDRSTGPSTTLRFGVSTSFSEAGKQLAESFTLNHRQRVALRLLCRQLDRVHGSESGGTPQLCQFVGGEGGCGKSRIIEPVVRLFANKGLSHRLLVTATSGTAAAGINGITIHSACNFSKDNLWSTSDNRMDRSSMPDSASLRIDGRTRMDWQEKHMLIIDEVSMLGARSPDM